MDLQGDKTGKYGGSIREGGGALGPLGAARENEYFRRQDEKKLDDLKKSIDAASAQKDKLSTSNQSQEKKN
jgi:hypothetical protein